MDIEHEACSQDSSVYFAIDPLVPFVLESRLCNSLRLIDILVARRLVEQLDIFIIIMQAYRNRITDPMVKLFKMARQSHSRLSRSESGKDFGKNDGLHSVSGPIQLLHGVSN